MPDPRSHVSPGQPLALAAEQVNWINSQMRGTTGFGGAALSLPQSPYTALPCRNDSGADIQRWHGVAITDVANKTDEGFLANVQPVLVGRGLEDGTTAWGVAVEPIPAGKYGLVAVSGAVQAKVKVGGAGYGEVRATASGLEVVQRGAARLLWAEPGSAGQEKWGVLLLGGGGGGGTSVRLGQFSGPWYNEPGETGSDNIKLVKLYVQPTEPTGPNDWVPELDEEGEEKIAVTVNLFSYIPTRTGNDSYMWCAVIPISTAGGEYWTGSYDYVDGQDVPTMRPYSELWMLLAAEC